MGLIAPGRWEFAVLGLIATHHLATVSGLSSPEIGLHKSKQETGL